MIRDVAAGPAFEAVLVRDVSRWGRFHNIDESAYWEFFFLAHGVRVLYVEEGFRDDGSPYSNLMKSLKRVVAAEFSRDKARMIQFADYRNGKAGYRLGGDPPFGYQRTLVNAAGEFIQVLRRGERKLINAHRIKLVPGNPAHVKIIQRIFSEVADGRSIGEVVRSLNRDGIPSPKGGKWGDETVRRMLTNAAYKGCSGAHFRQSANFAEKTHVVSEPSWRPLVDPAAWESVQGRLSHRHWLRSPAELAVQLREMFELSLILRHPSSTASVFSEKSGHARVVRRK